MNELLNIQGMDEFPISGRDLHERLGVGTAYTVWFPRMCEYGFEAGKDFQTDSKNVSRADGTIMPQMQTDHTMTLSMAKELCMLQRTDKGREVRRYLISVEEAWNKPEAVMARALKMADSTIGALKGTVITLEVANAELHEQVKQAKPKVLFADSVCASNSSILINELAKILNQNGIDTGANRLFTWLRENGYLGKAGDYYNLPTQYSRDLELFEEKKTVISLADGRTITRTTTKVTPKGQIYFVNKFLKGGIRRGEKKKLSLPHSLSVSYGTAAQ